MKNTDPIENILLLSIEDLNDWIAPLGGHPQAYTPNLTRLAARSVSFDQAYAAAPACSPSRTATLFGQAPWRNGIYHNRHSWAMAYPAEKTLSIVGQAQKAGWATYGAGKVFHLGKSGLNTAEWTDYFETPLDMFSPISRAISDGLLNELDDFGALSDDAAPLYDDRNLDYIKAKMTTGAQNTFWAYGIYRPHLPFIVPKRFFDLIKRPIEIPPGLQGKVFDPNDLSEFNKLPKPAQKLIRRKIGLALNETDEYEDFLHAYLASIAYADFLVGELLDHMAQNDLLENTLIVFWSDHGWQLGEKLAFRKFTLWERALRVPLMLSIPGGRVDRSNEPVSLLDIYPTLLNVIGQAPPHPLDGQDLMPLIMGKAGRGYAQSIWGDFVNKQKNSSDFALSVRTDQYRLIHYHDGAMELYNHGNDPYEHNNLLAAGLDACSEDILNICLSLMELLPHNPRDALDPSQYRDVLKDKAPQKVHIS